MTVSGMHSYVIGEISLDSLRDRSTVLRALNDLPRVPVATPDEVFCLIEQQQLFSRGIGCVAARIREAYEGGNREPHPVTNARRHAVGVGARAYFRESRFRRRPHPSQAIK